MGQAWAGTVAVQRHRERVDDDLGGHVVGHRPADDPAALGVLDRRQVQPALPGPEIGDVGAIHKTFGSAGRNWS